MDNETCCSMVFSCMLNFQNIWQQFFPPVLASVSSIIPDLASKLIDFMFLFIYIYIRFVSLFGLSTHFFRFLVAVCSMHSYEA
jgi:hypothetical protein